MEDDVFLDIVYSEYEEEHHNYMKQHDHHIRHAAILRKDKRPEIHVHRDNQ